MLRARWLGRTQFADAHALQRALFERAADPYLLLLEHPHVFTLGLRGTLDHVLADAGDLGAPLVRTDRGGDVTYHGPGQLVGYPILTWPNSPGATPAYVHSVEQLVIDVCADLGLAGAGRLAGFPGVWVDADRAARKVCAIGVRRSRGRTMHGFALNVDPDLSWFDRIVPCGIDRLRSDVTGRRGRPRRPWPRSSSGVVHRAAEAWDGGRFEFTVGRRRASRRRAPGRRAQAGRGCGSRPTSAPASATSSAPCAASTW